MLFAPTDKTPRMKPPKGKRRPNRKPLQVRRGLTAREREFREFESLMRAPSSQHQD